MDRLSELLYMKKQFLQDGEVLIFVKNDEMTARYHDEEGLVEVSGKVNEKLTSFLNWLQDENKY